MMRTLGFEPSTLNGMERSQGVVHQEFPQPHLAYAVMVRVQRRHHRDDRLPVPVPELFRGSSSRFFVSGSSIE